MTGDSPNENSKKELASEKNSKDEKSYSEDPEGSVKNIFDKIVGGFHEAIKDVTTLEVKTFLVDKPGEIEKLVDAPDNIKLKKDGSGAPEKYLIGYTRIDVDGDVTEILHGNPKSPPNEDLLSIHKQNREVGLESWNRFFKNMITITAAMYSLVTNTNQGSEIIKALRDDIKPIGQS